MFKASKRHVAAGAVITAAYPGVRGSPRSYLEVPAGAPSRGTAGVPRAG